MADTKFSEEDIEKKLHSLAAESRDAVNTLYPQRVELYAELHELIDSLTSSSLKRAIKFGTGYPLIPTLDVSELSPLEKKAMDLIIALKDIDVQLAFAALFIPKPEVKE